MNADTPSLLKFLLMPDTDKTYSDGELPPDYLAQVLNLIPAGVLVLSRSGDVVVWNATAERITGYTRDELPNSECLDRICGSDVKDQFEAPPALDGRPRRTDLERKDGRRITIMLQWAGADIPDEGRQGLYVFFDFTENVIDEDSVHIVNQLLFEAAQRMQNQANTDGLTGLLNHRAFQERIRQEVSRMRRHKTTMSVAMFDVDFFKDCNDRFGHQFGDRVLSNISETARHIFRREDVVARYGGEEFVILLPETPIDNALIIAERFRMAVEKQITRYHGDETQVTISCGVTCHHPESPEEDVDLIVLRLIQQADEALYQAKGSGRNKVVVHEYAQQFVGK